MSEQDKQFRSNAEQRRHQNQPPQRHTTTAVEEKPKVQDELEPEFVAKRSAEENKNIALVSIGHLFDDMDAKEELAVLLWEFLEVVADSRHMNAATKEIAAVKAEGNLSLENLKYIGKRLSQISEAFNREIVS